MNGLMLRINPSNNKNISSIKFGPIELSYHVNTEPDHDLVKKFIDSKTSEEQFGVVRSLLDANLEAVDNNLLRFLAIVFVEAEIKHPIKSFIIRSITKSQTLQDPFSEKLAIVLSYIITQEYREFQEYYDATFDIEGCIANFPAGRRAFKMIDLDLAKFLKRSLRCCVNTLCERNLAPTQKNELFEVTQRTLRLAFHIMQHVRPGYMDSLFEELRRDIKYLLFHQETPMDTKNVGGLLIYSMHILENGEDAWVQILYPPQGDDYLSDVLENESARLALLTAAIILTNTERLLAPADDEEPILTLAERVIAIGEKGSSECIIVLGVARAVEMTSKKLDKITDPQLGLELVDILLGFTRAHLTHYMDSVRHLSVKSLASMVYYCTRLQREGNIVALDKLFCSVSNFNKASKSHYVILSSLAQGLGTARLLARMPDVIRDVIGALTVKDVQSSATVTLETLLKYHVSGDVSTDELYDEWVAPALEHAAYARTHSAALSALEALLAKLLRLHEPIVERLVTTKVNTTARSPGLLRTAPPLPALGHAAYARTHSAALSALEALLAKLLRLHEPIVERLLPHIKIAEQHVRSSDLKGILLLVNALRRAGVADKLAGDNPPADAWKGLVSYDVLKRAAVDAVDETRYLALGVVTRSARTTEALSEGDLDFVLYFLKYNINSQDPHFRQLILALIQTFTKRLQDSYKPLARKDDSACAYYRAFLERFRAQCFASLVPGASYSRRKLSLEALCNADSVDMDGYDRDPEGYHFYHFFEMRKILLTLGVDYSLGQAELGERFAAMLLVAWTDLMSFDGYNRDWKEEYVEKLLLHLEDSYEVNKSLAMWILSNAPVDLITNRRYSVSLDVDTIIRQASSMKPTDCSSAAYKLVFLQKKLPELVLAGEEGEITAAEPAMFALVSRLLRELRPQLAVGARSVAAAARAAPMYGVLHCVGYFMTHCDPAVLAGDDQWRALIAELIDLCLLVNQSVACVVNNASPEGHLPMDAGGIATDDYGNTGDLRLEDGRPVTAQMVLLCAWRSVKEVSNILGTLVARMSIELEDETGLLSHEQLNRIGQHFTQLLAETKHRGAFEQAYVGFSRMLTRLWRCRSEELHLMPRMWLRDCIRVISAPQPGLSATRRSAGLPYMIMALTTTEVQVAGSPKYLPQCMTALLRLANYVPNPDVYPATSNAEQVTLDAEPENVPSTLNTTTHEPSDRANASGATNQDEPHDPYVEVRTHSMNILRALFKTSALEEALGGYVGEGLMVALRGFERETWMERNSSTLLFSALMVRIFGVDRARHSDLPALRNTMTGRIFFLRYPALYDFILNKLKEANESMEHELQPALCPVLLLLGRLYPSALEGTASALRLVALLPLVAAAARSPVRAARELSARALLPLVAPDQYMAFVEALLNVISDPEIKRNYCHGVLLQLTRLLDARPDEAALEGEALACLRLRLEQTLWIVEQADGDHACYVIADEYAKMINMLLWRFPSLISDDLLSRIQSQIHKVIFAYYVPPITSGRDVCIGNFVNLYFVLLRKSRNIKTSSELISLTLSHKTYEVVLSTLNYLLILHNSLDIEDCKFQKHLSTMVYLDILAVMRRRSDYIQKLCKIFETSKYPECNQKALKVLSLEKNTQKHIVGIKMGGKRVKYITDEEIIWKLFDCIQNEHENLTHIYLKSLCGFVSTKLQQSKIFPEIVLEVLRVIHSCSTSDNSDCTRQEVAEFMTANCEKLLKMDLGSINEKERFEFKSLIFGMLVTLLEDDEQSIRYAASNVVAAVAAPAGPGSPARVIPARAAEMLRAMLDEQPPAMLVMLALMDFKSEVCVTDDIGDECRVFDQNERYNVFLEECVWSTACADKILRTCGGEPSALEFVRRVLADALYRPTLEAMCCANLRAFEKLLDNQRSTYRNAVENPKIEVFLKKLRGEPV